jgi:hypothetical protein
MILAIGYLLFIVAAELVTIYGHPLWGMAVHGVLLVLLIVQSAIDSRYPHRPLLSLALVPLVRIISLCLTLVDIPLIWWRPLSSRPAPQLL